MQYDSFLLSVVIQSISTAQEITFYFHASQEKLQVQISSEFSIKPGKLQVLVEYSNKLLNTKLASLNRMQNAPFSKL